MPPPNIYLYIGKILPRSAPPPSDPRSLHHNDFLQEDMEKLDLSGKPHLIDHDRRLEVGKVLKSFNHRGEKYIIGYVDMRIPMGKALVDQIQKGDFRELSMFHDYALLTAPGKIVEAKRAVEVSSVMKGNRPSCKLITGILTRLDEKRYI